MSDVFISYSRKDIAITRLLQQSLQQSQVDIWIDWERIPVGERWWDEITAAIEQANVFMFIISKNSIGSQVCHDEIDQALKNHKRIIPIVVDDLGPEAVHDFAPELPQFNWIIFERGHIFRVEQNPASASEKPEDNLLALPRLPQFTQALEKLSQAIHTDWEWVKYHTRLQVDALRWDANEKNPSYLIRGAQLEEAEQQLFRAVAREPQPTSVQVEYVTASRADETRRQQERLLLEQRSRRRQRVALWAVGLGLIVALILGVIAWGQRNQYLVETHVRATAQALAVSEANGRATQAAIAVEQKNEAERQARIALAGKLDTETAMLLGKKNDLALLLSVEGYNYFPGPQSRGAMLNALLASARQLRGLHGNQASVFALAFSSNGKILATDGCAERDESFLCYHSETDLWDVQTGQLIGKLIGDDGTSAAVGMTFSPDGSRLLTVSQRGNIVIWDVKTQQALQKIRWHDRYVNQVAFQPGGTLIALGSCAHTVEGGIDAQISCEPGVVELWDTNTLQPLPQVLSGNAAVPSALAFSPDGKYLVSADYENEVLLWNLQNETSQIIMETAAPHFVSSAAFSADSTLLALGDTGDMVSFLSVPEGQTLFPAIKLVQDLAAVALFPDGKTLVTASYGSNSDNELSFWDVETSAQIGKPLTGFADYLGNLVINPNGSMLAGGIKTVYLWDAVNPQLLASQTTLPTDQRPLGISPDGTRLVSGGYLSSTMSVWDMVGRKMVALVEHLPDSLTAVKFLPDGGSFFSYSPKGGLTRWDAGTGTPVNTSLNKYQDNMYHASFSPDGRFLQTSAGSHVHIWNTTSGGLQADLVTGMDGISSLAFSMDGQWAAAGGCAAGAEAQVGTTGLHCSQGEVVILDVASQAQVVRLRVDLPDEVRGVAFSPDRKSLAVIGNNMLQLWDLTRLEPATRSVSLMQFVPADVTFILPGMLGFSPDGNILAVGDQIGGNLFLFSTETLQPLMETVRAGFNLRSLAFTPDSSQLIAGGDSPYTIDLTGKTYGSVPFIPSAETTFSNIVNSLAVSPDGATLASGSESASIDLWNISGSMPVKITTLQGHAGSVTALAFSPDGKVLYSASQDMTLDRWDVGTGQMLDQPLKGYTENSMVRGVLSEDGSRLATSSCRIVTDESGCVQGEIGLFNTITDEKIASFKPAYRIFALAFSPDGRWLADSSAAKITYNIEKGTVEIHLWKLDSDSQASRTLLSGGDTEFSILQFSPDGKILGALAGGKLSLLDVPSGEALNLPGSITAQNYSSLAFSADGQVLALGSNNGIQLYDLMARQVIGPPITGLSSGLSMNNSAMLFSPDGKQLIVGGPVTIWTVDDSAWAAFSCQVANRNLTAEEWTTYLGETVFHETCPDLP